jgi:IPT/TIG domain-containing protein/HYDIN/CFA65/VesB family protein
MFKIRNRKSWIALLGILLLFAACKGETPTAPPAGGGNNGGGGGTTPPSNVTLTLSASNSNPIIDSTVTITATVTQNGTPVANGTAVEFVTSAGTFIDVTPAVKSLIRTTTNGVATVNLTDPNAEVAHVTATVNNVTRTIDVTFKTVAPCVPPDPRCPVSTAPTITSVTPSIGKPQGGDIIHISGTNFFGPVRVLFDVGTGTPVQGFVTNITDTGIDVITPAVNLGAGQQLVADIIVVTQIGSATEGRVVANDAFTFRNVQLTPTIATLSPTSGPINGGTRVTIFGEGFQPPVQVFFGSAEAQVVSVDFGQIIVVAPDARSTNPNGSGTVTGPVAVSVVNINSNTRATSPQQFRYVAKMEITAISPLAGSALGGTDITIDGNGFDSPLQVLIGDSIEAQVIRVSGTQLVVRTRTLANACSGASGPIRVTNIENGDTATSNSVFTFIAVPPEITSVTSATAGQSTTVTVRNPGVGALGEGSIRFSIAGRTLIPSPSVITTGTGSQVFSVTLPTTGFNFPTEACTTALSAEPGTRFGPVEATITFQNLTTGCTASATITVNPPTPNPCLTEPQPVVTDPAAGCVTPPPANVGSAPLTTQDTITIMNETEAQPLNINSIAITGPDAADFTIQPATATNITAGNSRVFTVTFDPSTVGAKTATITFNTNSSSRPTLTVCVTATANP